MRIRKILSTVTAVAVSAGLLTACGNNSEVQTATCPTYEILDAPEVTEYVPVEAAYSSEEIGGNFNAAFLKLALLEKDNVVISPLSVKMIVNIAAAGSVEGSETQTQMMQLFAYDNMNTLKGDSRNLIDEMNRGDGTLSMYNSCWKSDKAADFTDDYRSALNDTFSADVFSDDLTSDYFVNHLNTRVSDETNGMIPQLLNKPLDESARLVLVNTLYFNNEWKYKFENYSSHNRDFYGNKGTETVPLMHQSELHLDYGEGKQFRSLSLPYKDGSVMNVYLPLDNDKNIADIIGEMTPAELTDEFECVRTESLVNVAIPKFECEYDGSLKMMLRQMGMERVFSPSDAELCMIDSDEPLYISEVIQAVKIRCDEEGTEAAAATMAEIAAGAAPQVEQPIQFTVDRPFVYEIKSPSGETLFMGVIQNFSE